MELNDLASALALKELELSAQGYQPHQVNAAIRFAWKRAEGVAIRAPQQHQQSVFLANVEQNLEACERWLAGNVQAAAEGDMDRGIDQAARDRRPLRGYQRMGVDGRYAVRRWKEGLPASKEGYRQFFADRS